MTLESLIQAAAQRAASDLHLEAGMPACIRQRGELKSLGEAISVDDVSSMAKELLSDVGWQAFRDRGSADLSRNIAGVRCRINVLRTSRGVGLAIRLLSRTQPTIRRLNLLPELAELAELRQGLILICGPTGSGKSSTMAALIHEINKRDARHIVTLEEPVEFLYRPRRCLIRQREVGLDTPSFEQGLLDALREDPDVLMVGEMRHPETIRLTLNAAETGHLVLSTVHSSSVAEALHRITAAFPAEIQSMVSAQLADCLQAVICQQLPYNQKLGIRVPDCEILRGSMAVKSVVRQGQYFKLQTILETGGKDGQYTRRRYRKWLEQHQDFFIETDELPTDAELDNYSLPLVDAPAVAQAGKRPRAATVNDDSEDDIIVIKPPTGSLSDILEELDRSD